MVLCCGCVCSSLVVSFFALNLNEGKSSARIERNALEFGWFWIG